MYEGCVCGFSSGFFFGWDFLSGVCLPTVATMSFAIHNVMCCCWSPSVILGQLCQNERKKTRLSALHLKTTGMTCANSFKKISFIKTIHFLFEQAE